MNFCETGWGPSGKPLRLVGRAGVLAIAFLVQACQKPQLRSDKAPESEEKVEETLSEKSLEPYQKIRRSVIGKTFETLTIGPNKFAKAEVRAISDEFITIAHEGGVAEVPWSDVPPDLLESWGHNPAASSLANAEMETPTRGPDSANDETPKNTIPDKPTIDPRLKAQKLARKEKMLAAQWEGVRTIESDLARHQTNANNMRRRLQSIQALNRGARSGGIRVERIEGKSSIVDRKAEAREIAGKLQVEDQMVAQLSKSLQAAKQKYLAMKQEVDQLRRQ